MISPHTKPGTKVVCVKLPTFGYADNSDILEYRKPSIIIGGVYTVAEIYEDPLCFLVGLHEVDKDTERYALSFFDYLVLPESLASLLDEKPVNDFAIAPEPAETV